MSRALRPSRSPSPRSILPAALHAARALALTTACALAVPPAAAVEEARFAQAAATFMAASGGDAGAIDAAADAFSKLLAAEPGHPVLMAYAGAATTMRASTALSPWKKMGFAEDGLALLDKALALLTPADDAVLLRGVPAAIEVRFTAASTFLAVPGFLNRGARGAKLLDEVLASPLLAQTPLPFRGLVWMRAARLAADEHRTADAQRWLDTVVASGAPQAPAAAAQRKALGS